MPDTSKPNPNYVNAPFEIGEWTPELGAVFWKEVARDGGSLVLEGRTADGRVLGKTRRWNLSGPLFKPDDWQGEGNNLVALFERLNRLEGLLSRMCEQMDKLTGPATITVKGGTVLTPDQAKEALESAMQIIESVGTTGIYHKCGQANKWMLRFFPNWA